MVPQKSAENKFTLNDILDYALQHGASDIQITAGAKPSIRVNGMFVEMEGAPILTPSDTMEIAYSILTDEQREKLKVSKQIDLSFSGPKSRYRANIYYQRSSISISIRQLKTDIPSIEDLHLPSFIKDFAYMKNGLIIVSGPPGAGKSTTCASLLKVASERGVHIITIEDPVEYLIPHHKGIVDQREVGTDVQSFEDGMIAVTRENPDIVFIGEIRDAESAKTALSLAVTGHLVITTIHAFPATVAVDRILSFLADKEWNRKLFAMNFVAVIAQMLIPTNNGMYPIYEILEHSTPVQNCIIEGRLPELKTYMRGGRNVPAQKSLEILRQKGLIDDDAYNYYLNFINNI